MTSWSLSLPLLAGLMICSADAASNAVARSLIEVGVPIAPQVLVKLPEPWMADGLGAEAQEAVLRRVAGRYPLEEFLRDSPVARFVLDIQPLLDGQGRRSGQRLDLAFASRGSLELIRRKNLLDQLVAVGKSSARGLEVTSGVLSESQLAARQIPLAPQPGIEESFLCFSAPVLDRVRLRGVHHQMVTCGEHSLLAAQELDPRFSADAEFPNQWRPLRRTPSGEFAQGEPQPYAGMGQYVKVTALVDGRGQPKGTVFIEAHLAFHEPQGWFGGANLLGSKLPLAVQDHVRAFRRLLRQDSGQAAVAR